MEEAQARWRAQEALLAVIGQSHDDVRDIELEPGGEQFYAIRRAFERFKRDHPDDTRAASEIETLSLDMGLTFKERR